MRRFLHLRFAVAALLALSLPLPALADPPGPPEVKVMQPPGFDLATLKEVLTTPKPSAAGAVATVAALAMWSAIGNVMADSKMCYEAYEALSSTTHHQFSVKVNVVNVGGDPVMSYSQSYLAVYAAGGVAYAPIIVYADGRVVTGPIKYCGGGRSWNFPLTASLPPTAGPAHWRVGILRITHETQQGKVSIILPDDIRAGDTISGTVVIEPQGATNEERMANAAQLSGYVIDVEGQRSRVADGRVLLKIGPAGGMVPLLLRDTAANPVNVMGIAASPVDTPLQPQPAPAFAQAASPMPIPGAFDGDAANTKASINGRPVTIIAESPRQTVIDCPPELTGPAEIVVTDKGSAVSARTNLIGILLQAPRTTLMRGEKTQVTLTVSGLQGLRQPVHVALQASPSVRLEGGNLQTVPVDPARANATGAFQRSFQLSSTAPGPFEISAALTQLPAAPAPAQNPPIRRNRQRM